MNVVGGKQEVDKEIAVGMCQATWKIMLTALSQLLARSSSEEIILHLLKVGPDPNQQALLTMLCRLDNLSKCSSNYGGSSLLLQVKPQ